MTRYKAPDFNNIFLKLVDFEYSKFMIMSHIQQVKSFYSQQRLYPYLGDSIALLEQINNTKKSILDFKDTLPTELATVSTQMPDINSLVVKDGKLVMKYKNESISSDLTETLLKVLSLQSDKMQDLIEEGAEIYDFYEQTIELDWLGIVPPNNKSGFLLFPNTQLNRTDVFLYGLNPLMVKGSDQKYHSLSFEKIGEESFPSISQTPAKIKQAVFEKEKNRLVSPAFLWAESNTSFTQAQFNETVFPITKRLAMKMVLAT